MTQERKHQKENSPQMSKLQIRNHPLQKMSRHLHNPHKLKPSLNNNQKMPPSLSSSKKAKPARHSRPKDDSTSTLQSQDKSVPEQRQQHASDTLTSSEDSTSPLPDYGEELKLFTTKDPHSIPKKPRYSSRPKPE